MSAQIKTHENGQNIPNKESGNHQSRLNSLKNPGSNFGIPGRGEILPNKTLLPANSSEQFQNAPVLSNIPFSPEPIKQENNIVKIEERKVPEGYKQVPITALPPTTVAQVQESIAKSMRLFNPRIKGNPSRLEEILVGKMYK